MHDRSAPVRLIEVDYILAPPILLPRRTLDVLKLLYLVGAPRGGQTDTNKLNLYNIIQRLSYFAEITCPMRCTHDVM